MPNTNNERYVDNPYLIAGGYSQDNYPVTRKSGWPTSATGTTTSSLVTTFSETPEDSGSGE